MAREPISKKLRFEVFKKDSFTCQYCGRMSPDVLLEVDHVKPVSKGGNNNILNLVTACRDCNRGKFNKELSETSVVKKQQDRIKELAEKKEQLNLLIDWQEDLLNIDRDVATKLSQRLSQRYKLTKEKFGEDLIDFLMDCIKKYSARVVIDACYKYTEDFFAYDDFDKICRYIKNDINNPWGKDVNYIVKILYNRDIIYFSEKKSVFMQISNIIRNSHGSEEYKNKVIKITNIASKCNDLVEFKEQLENL